MTTGVWWPRTFRLILVCLVGNWLVSGKLSYHSSKRHHNCRFYDILRHSLRQSAHQLFQGAAMPTLPHFGLQMLPWYLLGLMGYLGTYSKCIVQHWAISMPRCKDFRMVAFPICTGEDIVWTGTFSVFFLKSYVSISCPLHSIYIGSFFTMLFSKWTRVRLARVSMIE